MSAPLRRIISERRPSQPVSSSWLPDSHWFASLLRAFHPIRLGLCLAGLLGSWIAASMALGLLGLAGPEIVFTHQRLGDLLARLGQRWGELGPVGQVLLGATLAGLLGAVWGPIAAWIARDEVMHRLGARTGPNDPGPTTFVARHLQSLVWLVAFLALIFCLLSLPGLVARFVDRSLGWGVGAFLVALVLPLLLAVSFVQIVMLLGAASWLIMPAAIAAERTDGFDALSRGYSYLYQRPFFFTFLQFLALLPACLPMLAVELLGWSPGWEYLLLTVVALTVGLSLLWTLQTFAYLKLRLLVDGQREADLADEEESPVDTPPQGSRPETNGTVSAEPVRVVEGGVGGLLGLTPDAGLAAAEPARSVTFRDTLWAGRGVTPTQLIFLLLGIAWAGLMLAVAILLFGLAVHGRLDWGDLTPAVLQRLLDEHGPEHLLTLLLLAVTAAVCGMPCLLQPTRMLARSTTLFLLRGHLGSLRSNLDFARRSSRPGRFAVILLTAGVQLTLLAVVLLPLGWQGDVSWESLLGLAGAALGLIALGSFACGSAAEEGLERPQGDPFSCLFGNLPETLASGLLALPLSVGRWLGMAALAALTWWLLCDVVAPVTDERGEWLRWGIDGFGPRGEGMAWLASLIAGFWFLLLGGAVAVYPFAYLIRWGTACYLRARSKFSEGGGEDLHLSPEEQTALAARRSK